MEIDFNKDIPPQLQPMDEKVIVLFKLLTLMLRISGAVDSDIESVWDLVKLAYVSGGTKAMKEVSTFMVIDLDTLSTLKGGKHGLN